MLKIRLQRTGRKHEPTFKLVLTDSKNSTKSGKFLEVLGSHDFRGSKKPTIKAERILYWMKHGAKLTDTLHNLLISEKIIQGKKVNVLPKKTVVSTSSSQVGTEALKAASTGSPQTETKAPEQA